MQKKKKTVQNGKTSERNIEKSCKTRNEKCLRRKTCQKADTSARGVEPSLHTTLSGGGGGLEERAAKDQGYSSSTGLVYPSTSDVRRRDGDSRRCSREAAPERSRSILMTTGGGFGQKGWDEMGRVSTLRLDSTRSAFPKGTTAGLSGVSGHPCAGLGDSRAPPTLGNPDPVKPNTCTCP